ncbi:hypothetical protein CVT25_014904 [Psilocybe cyanescens]|uniref:Uncharacterized protein n=1 Tax=Psilocybe cyanescens TaxID=93625 RepID=A0A409WF48_PSICY|nr:hypothetical protein CVT25_014904 [Psilocybe cyanescens]
MANSQVVAYTTFIASEAFLADKSLVDKALDYLKKREGALRYISLSSRMFDVWETYEVIDKTLKSANFLGFMMTFNTLIEAGDCSWQHIDFDEDPFNALGSPITELSIGRPKEGHPREELYSIVLQLKENSSLYPGVHHPLTWGVVRQTSEFVLAIGWDSVQAHLNAIQVPPAKPLAAKLSDISDLVVHHIILYKI